MLGLQARVDHTTSGVPALSNKSVVNSSKIKITFAETRLLEHSSFVYDNPKSLSVWGTPMKPDWTTCFEIADLLN